jgi:hypothetical protein
VYMDLRPTHGDERRSHPERSEGSAVPLGTVRISSGLPRPVRYRGPPVLGSAARRCSHGKAADPKTGGPRYSGSDGNFFMVSGCPPADGHKRLQGHALVVPLRSNPHFSQALCRRLCGAVDGHFELTLSWQGRKYACG